MDLNGKIIVIEGTDGSGKQTQAAKLKEKLINTGNKVFSTSFPNYESASSALVKMYLNGEIKENANDVSAKAASIFYAADRYITYKKEIEPVYLAQDSVLVFDRYVASNIIHQGAKLLSKYPTEDSKDKKRELQEFVKWLYNLEHEDFGIPKADVTIYLNVPIEYTIKLREQRVNKITGGEKQDIHESDVSHLKNASAAGMLAANSLGWNVIECVKGGKMRAIDDIAEEIWQIVSK